MTHAPLIHVGLPKTATTTLQDNLFAQLDTIRYLGKPITDTRVRDALAWIEDDSMERDAPDESPGPLFEGPTDRVTVLSEERLTSHGQSDLRRLATRLTQIAPEAHILVTIREQTAMLPSIFLQELRRAGRYERVPDYATWLQSSWDAYHADGIGPLRQLRLRDTISPFRDAFGPGRVHVLTLETLARDPARFASQLAPLLATDADACLTALQGPRRNTGLTKRQLTYQRLRNRIPRNIRPGAILPGPIRRAGQRFLHRGDRTRVETTPEWRTRIQDLTAEDNQWVADTFGLDLASQGYATPNRQEVVA